MTTSPSPALTDPRVVHYLESLTQALWGLPESVRSEVYDGIRQHIDDEVAQHAGDISAIPEVLERLGDPQAIAREAGAYPAPPAYPLPPRPQSRALEIAAVILLAIGGFIGGIGWVVGVVLLWVSKRFTLADKLIGTLLLPGGLLTSFLALFIGAVGPAPLSNEECSAGAVTTCTGGTSHLTLVIVLVVAAALVVGPIYTTIRLSRRVASM